MISKEIKIKNGLSLQDRIVPVRQPEIDLIDRRKLLAQLELFRRDWKAATRGDMHRVTLDLKMLLDDIDNIVRACDGK